MDASDEGKSVISNTLFNGDKYITETMDDEKSASTSLYSKLYKKNILKIDAKEVSNTKTTFNVDIYKEDKSYEYNYDLSGNIISIRYN